MLRSTTILVSASFLLFAGCSSGSGGGEAEVTIDQMPVAGAEMTRTKVSDLLRTVDVAPVGITITPDTGELVLLDARQGVFVLGSDRRFTNVATADDLYAQIDNDSDFTDIAALGNDRFAVTARNDGFLLDLSDGSIVQHFCYVPPMIIPPFPGPIVEQLTESVAYHPGTDRIIAQPITFWNGVITNTEVATFPITGGIGNDWRPIDDPEFLAGAITVDDNHELWLGRESELCKYDLTTNTLTLEQTLERFDVFEIQGMVFDGGDLLVVEGSSATIVRIPKRRL